MRFIGNKEKLLDQIYSVVAKTGLKEGKFCDFFSGTANVGRYFKKKGYQIISSDILYCSYVLQKAYIANNQEPTFSKLIPEIEAVQITIFASPYSDVLAYLNSLPGKKGFIYENYTLEGTADKDYQRMYFLPENGMKIDAIRETIEEWKNRDLVNEDEYFILLASLIETVPFYANISGVYAAFLKTYDPRALKPLKLRPIEIYESNLKHEVHCGDSTTMLEQLDTDILYLDPPYNARQYGPNYHMLETIARYDDPVIKGITGLRNTSDQKSDFCNAKTALIALNKIAEKAKYRYLLLSYNSEGIMKKEDILATLGRYGKVELVEIEYRRFKSNSNGNSKHMVNIHEHVYLLSRS